MQRLVTLDAVPAGLEVWQIDLTDLSDSAADREILSPSEKSKAEEFLQIEDRVRFVKTHAVLRVLLCQYLKCLPQQIFFQTGAHGKPYLDPDHHKSTIAFNLSHAGDFALIALSENTEVGIDIEYCNPDLNIHDLANLVLTPTEYQAVLSSTQPVDKFFKHWVGKEALLKALGLGIGEHLQHFTLSLNEQGHYDIQLSDIKELNKIQCFACQLAAPKNYAAALAWLA